MGLFGQGMASVIMFDIRLAEKSGEVATLGDT
jgi:hypothetical protein